MIQLKHYIKTMLVPARFDPFKFCSNISALLSIAPDEKSKAAINAMLGDHNLTIDRVKGYWNAYNPDDQL